MAIINFSMGTTMLTLSISTSWGVPLHVCICLSIVLMVIISCGSAIGGRFGISKRSIGILLSGLKVASAA